MQKWWERAKVLWAGIGHIWLAKDIGTALGLWTGAGFVVTPILFWAFTPLSPVDALFLGLVGAVIAFFTARSFAPRVRNIHHLPVTAQTAPIASLTAQKLPVEERDVWLQDAVCYAVHGRWLGENEQAFSTEAQMSKAGAIAAEMRQLAYDGKFNIWGKESPVGVYELIPKDFWQHHQIDFLRLVGDDARNGRTERAAFAADSRVYRELMVSKSQTEAQWPAP